MSMSIREFLQSADSVESLNKCRDAVRLHGTEREKQQLTTAYYLALSRIFRKMIQESHERQALLTVENAALRAENTTLQKRLNGALRTIEKKTNKFNCVPAAV